MEYQVTITETLSHIELVEASSAIEAEDFVRDRYSKCDIVLNDTHFIGTDFETNQVVHNISTPCRQPSLHPYYTSKKYDFQLYNEDSFELLPLIEQKFDMIFADPPYFLSNGGISVQSGEIVSVNKGDWDKGLSDEEMSAFNHRWISLCREKLKDSGTIWVSGTYHNIFSVANALKRNGFKILNVIHGRKPTHPQTPPAAISPIQQNSSSGQENGRRCLIITTTN